MRRIPLVMVAVIACLPVLAIAQPAPPGDIIIGQFFFLTLTKAGNGAGTVTSAPQGITCGSDCSEPYPPNTVVTITATATGGSTFTGWTGGGCAGTGPCQVTMSQAQGVTATFTASVASTTYTASVGFTGTQGANQWFYLYGPNRLLMDYDAANAQWKGTEQFSLIWADGTHPGAVVDAVRQWRSPGAGSIRITGTVFDTNTSCGGGVTARIAKNTTTLFQQNIANGDTVGIPFDLTTTVAIGDPIEFIVNQGPDGNNNCDATGFNPTIVYTPDTVQPPAQFPLLVSPTVTSVGTGTISGPGIACGTDCNEVVTSTTTVPLTATPASGSTFTGWTGACSGTGACNVSMSQSRVVLATFGLQTGGGTFLTGTCTGLTTDNQECIAANPAVFMAENFESRNVETFFAGSATTMQQPRYKATGPNGLGWDPSATNMYIVSSPARGTRAMQWRYPAGEQPGAGFYALRFPPASPSNPNGGPKYEFYARMYAYYPSDFPLGCANGAPLQGVAPGNPQNCTTKFLEMGTDSTFQPSTHYYHFQAQGIAGAGPGGVTNPNKFSHIGPQSMRSNGIDNNGGTLIQNVNGEVEPVRDTWQCIEFHVRINSAPGVADGLFEGWIDGVQHFNYPNFPIQSTGVRGPIEFIQMTASGSGNIYNSPNGNTRGVDNIILATQRIGCF